jgi:hypothetical protein
MKKICKNCMDYNTKKEECTIRYIILKDKTKIPMKRNPYQKGCSVFLLNGNKTG